MLGEDFDAYEASLDQPMYHGLRVNTAKISVEEFLRISPFSLTPVPWCDTGFYLDEDNKASKHPYYFAGLYYLQEPSAMYPAAALPVEPGDRVLDVCAAPGGKSTALAAKLEDTGLLISNDISHSRAKALLKNLELFGAPNAVISSEPVNVLGERFPGFFDKILIDAPCSGEGMFRKSSSMVTAWEQNGVPLFVNLQQSILRDVIACLAPGGMLLYSTCTFSPEEDEREVEYLLSLDPSLSLVELPAWEGMVRGRSEWGETGNPELSKTVRFFPHKVKGEGHFAALFQKAEAGGGTGAAYHQNKDPKLSKETEAFLGTIHRDFPTDRIYRQQERLYLLPEGMPDVSGLRLLRQGLFLGEEKKNRFEPSQSLAMALRKEECPNTVDFTAEDPRVIRYLKGETVEAEEAKDGWVLICVDGYPLGWGKANRGTVKNKYLPGWRWM